LALSVDFCHDCCHVNGHAERGTIVAVEPGRNKDSAMLVRRREFPALGPYVAPRTPTEQQLVEIFRNALGMDQVSITDDFEELGGDSLIAASISMDIEKIFAIAVPIASLERSPTIERLAPRIEDLICRRKE
jgi:acyl carrier protein